MAEIGTHVDIPLGQVYGLKTLDAVNYTTGFVSVGVSSLVRNPTTLGGNNAQ